jgi:acetyl-CoA acetyltransferase
MTWWLPAVSIWIQEAMIMEKPSQPYQMNPPLFLQPITSPERFGEVNMLFTAENVAEKYHLNREELDAFAVESHKKAAKAGKTALFEEQILPIEIIDKKETTIVSKDETSGGQYHRIIGKTAGCERKKGRRGDCRQQFALQ